MQSCEHPIIKKLYSGIDYKEGVEVGPAVAVSAPGKLMLFGEHAVMYGKPCVVTAIDRNMLVGAARTPDNSIQINAPDVSNNPYKFMKNGLSGNGHPEKFGYVISALRNFYKKFKDEKDVRNSGVVLQIESQFGDAVSMGTSASVTTGVVAALRELYGNLLGSTKYMNLRQTFELAFEIISLAKETIFGRIIINLKFSSMAS